MDKSIVSTVYVNSAWDGMSNGTVVALQGGTATIGIDAFATGDAAVSAYGDLAGEREIAFLSDGNLTSFGTFNTITLDANFCVTCSCAMPDEVMIHIDGSSFADSTKRVLVAQGGFNEENVNNITVGGGFGYQFIDAGTALLVRSDLITDTFADTEWTAEDIEGKFFGDEALVWKKNAFNNPEEAAAKVGATGTLYIMGGTTGAANVVLPANQTNDVWIMANTAGTAFGGSLGGNGGTLHVDAYFVIGSINGFSFVDINGVSVTVGATVQLPENGTLNFDVRNRTPDSGPMLNVMPTLSDNASLTVTVSTTQTLGVYALVYDVSSFDGNIAVLGEDGGELCTLTVGSPEISGERAYSLTVTNCQLILTVALPDTTPPVAPTASADVITLTNGNVTVSAVFSDDSTLKEYSLDGQSWSTYTEPVALSENGTVSFRGIDEAGNVSDVTSYEVTNIDKVAPAAPTFSLAGDAATDEVVVTARWDADDAECLYSLDGQTWQTCTAPLRFSDDAQVQFKTVDAAGNSSTIADCKVKLSVMPDDIVAESTGDAQVVVSWSSDGLGDWADGYDVQLTVGDAGTLILNAVSGQGVELCNAPADVTVGVKPSHSQKWPAEGKDIESTPAADGPRVVTAETDDFTDVMFGRATGVWNANYRAGHVSLPGEKAKLTGKNQIGDLFLGSDDASILLLTDDANGDVFFLDDIYSAFPEGVDVQARVAKIDSIYAGAGADVVDLTSTRFEYVGGGLTVHGGLGDDVIWANSGHNLLFGDGGNDRLVGASDSDVLVGGAGDDAMHGGGGDDLFVFGGDWGNDTVTQFADGKVTLWFADGDDSKWNESMLTYTDGTNSVQVFGVADVSLKFGDDDSELYQGLLEVGAFEQAVSDRIFRDDDRGMLA